MAGRDVFLTYINYIFSLFFRRSWLLHLVDFHWSEVAGQHRRLSLCFDGQTPSLTETSTFNQQMDGWWGVDCSRHWRLLFAQHLVKSYTIGISHSYFYFTFFLSLFPFLALTSIFLFFFIYFSFFSTFLFYSCSALSLLLSLLFFLSYHLFLFL